MQIYVSVLHGQFVKIDMNSFICQFYFQCCYRQFIYFYHFQHKYNQLCVYLFQNNISQVMNSNVLGEEQNLLGMQLKSLMRAQMKIQHLSSVNQLLRQQLSVLKPKLETQQRLIDCWTSSHRQSQQLQGLKQVIVKLRQQNSAFQRKLHQIIHQNQNLMTQRLLKQQIHQQSTIQYQVAISRYEKKIFQLRQSVQQKQIYIQSFEENMNKNKFIELPGTDSYYLNKFCNFLDPYEKLIEQLKNQLENQKDKNKKNNFLQVPPPSMFTNKSKMTENKLQACQSSKILMSQNTFGNSTTYNLKPNANNKQAKQQNLLYLRTTLELKKYQNQLRETKIKLNEYKAKDKVMKQGYKILSKENELLNNQVFSLKIKNKSLTLQSSKRLKSQSIIMSNIKEQKIQSQTNCESKHYLVQDSNLHSLNPLQGKLDERIYEIQEDLSVEGIQELNFKGSNKQNQNKSRCPTDRFQQQLRQKPTLRNKQSKTQYQQHGKDFSLSIDVSMDEQYHERSQIKKKKTTAFEYMEEMQFD